MSIFFRLGRRIVSATRRRMRCFRAIVLPDGVQCYGYGYCRNLLTGMFSGYFSVVVLGSVDEAFNPH